MDESPSEVCGYVWPENHNHNDPSYNQSCCYRKSLPDSEYCVWHSESNERTAEDFQEAFAPPEVREKNSPYGELLDGAIIPEIEFTDGLFAHTSFRGASLDNVDFKGMSLTGADFREANLSNVDFSKSDISRVDFRFANLSGADLSSADVYGSDFREADLHGANLFEADLSEADFRSADLCGANLSLAKLTGAELVSADLFDTNFKQAYLPDADLRFADLADADLRIAELTNVNLSGTDLNNAEFCESNLTNADLQESKLTNTDFSRSDLRGADFSRADLSGADFSEATVRSAKFRINDLVKFSEVFDIKLLDEGEPASAFSSSSKGDNWIDSTVILLSALYKERDSLISLLRSYDSLHEKTGRLDSTIFETNTKGRFVVKAEGESGNVRIRTTAADLIETYEPKFVILYGIAAGFKQRVNKGDVIVADKVIDLRKYKIEDRFYFETDIIESPAPLEYPINLESLTEKIERTSISFDIHTDRPIASSDTLSRQVEFMKSAKETHRKVGGLEMEAAGVAEACKETNTGFFIIKAVSDYGGKQKDDSLHSECCKLSAETVTKGFLMK